MAGNSRKDSECITSGYPLRDYQVCSYIKKKDFRLCLGSSKEMFKKISEFCQISLKILPYLTDFSPQLMACMDVTVIFHFPMNTCGYSLEVPQRGALMKTHNTLRKNAYSNIMKILPPKNENLQIENSDIFHVSPQNIDCGYLLEPPRVKIIQACFRDDMFLWRNWLTKVPYLELKIHIMTMGQDQWDITVIRWYCIYILLPYLT